MVEAVVAACRASVARGNKEKAGLVPMYIGIPAYGLSSLYQPSHLIPDRQGPRLPGSGGAMIGMVTKSMFFDTRKVVSADVGPANLLGRAFIRAAAVHQRPDADAARFGGGMNKTIKTSLTSWISFAAMILVPRCGDGSYFKATISFQPPGPLLNTHRL